MNMKTGDGNGLIIIDVQNDFCPGGALAIVGGDEIIPVINSLSSKFDNVIATQDWHPAGHTSFAKTHNREPYEEIVIGGVKHYLWPEHCVPGTFGADFHKDLDLRNVDLIIRMGNDPMIDSYSAFLEHDKKTETGLHYYLKGLKLNHIFLCGLATDYCVFFSALDAVDLGFQVTVILDACRGVDMPAGNVDRAIGEMKRRGVRIVNHDAI